MKIGKTVIKRKAKNNDQQNEEIISKENQKSKMIKGKTSLGKKTKKQNEEQVHEPDQEKTPSEFLLEQIIISYCIDKWQKNIEAMKHRVTSKPNKKSKDLRHFIRVLNNTIQYHTYLYLMELFDNMSQMPFPEGLVHDPDYGKLIIIKNEPLRNKEKSENKEIKKNKEETDLIEVNDELKPYFYRNDGKPLDRIEIEEDIKRLIDLNPEKDIDVERILNSKRLQYKLKHPRFSPFTKKENIEFFVRYLYTYKPTNDKEKKENIVIIKNKTYAYY
jgi:hypothetical protein